MDLISPTAERSRPTRLAIVGFGKMGRLHLRAFRRIAGVEIVGAVDVDPPRASEAEAEGVSFAAEIGGLAGTIDAAVIATPPDRHAEVAVPLLEAGVDCLVEKPIALSPAEARRMVAAAEAGGARLAIGQNERFNVQIERALAVLGQGAGEAAVVRRSTFANGCRQTDVVQDLMVHDLDWILRHEANAACEIAIREARARGGRLDHVLCHLDFGTRRYLLAASHADGRRERTIEVRRDGADPRVFNLIDPAGPGEPDPLMRQAQSFLELRAGRASDLSSGREALAVMALTETVRAHGLRFADGAGQVVVA